MPIFDGFLGRHKVGQKSIKSGILAATGESPGNFWPGLRPGAGPRGGKEGTSPSGFRPKSRLLAETARIRDFFGRGYPEILIGEKKPENWAGDFGV